MCSVERNRATIRMTKPPGFPRAEEVSWDGGLTVLTLVKYGVTWDELGTLAGVRWGSRAAVSVSCDIVAHLAWGGRPISHLSGQGWKHASGAPYSDPSASLEWGEMGNPLGNA